MNLYQLIKSDYLKWKKYGGKFFTIVFFSQGFWAIFQHRLAYVIYRKIKIPILRQILMLIMLFWQKVIELISGISIPASTKIGHSFYIAHFGGIVLNSKSIIGNNCNISQGVTIGVSGVGEKRGVPIIGNNVYIGVNAVIVGKIKIENNVLIGACSLVNKDVQENSIVIGVPAIKVSNKGSKGYI
jgi:serine O-acetyltransferase